MTDIIAGGGTGRGRRHRTAALAALVVAGGLLGWLGHRGHPRAQAAPARPTATASRPAAGTDLALYAARTGGGLTRIDLRTGVKATVTGLPAHGRLSLLPVRGGLLASSATRSWLCVGSTVVRTLPFGGPVAPAATDAAVWIHRNRAVRLIDLTGRPLSGWISLPAGTTLLRETGGAMVLRTGTGTALWDQRAGFAKVRLGRFLAASATEVATADPRGVRLTGGGTAETHVLPLPAGASARMAAFSPDGQALAVLADHVYVSAAGRIVRVPDITAVEDGARTSLTWASDSRSLALSSAIADTYPPHTWISVWSAGLAHPRIVARDGLDGAYGAG